MRRYDIVSGILLILSIIDFALAAPVSTQEKHQKIADVAQIPKNVITMSGKRWEEDLGKLGEEFLKTGDNPVVSSDLHPSSGSAPSGLGDPGSTTNVVQPPAAPNLASSSATNQDLSSSGCSSSKSSKGGLWARGSCWSSLFEGETWPGPDVDHWSNKHEDNDMTKFYRWPFNVGPSGLGMDYKLTTPLLPQWFGKPDPRPLIDPDDDFDWDSWLNAPDPPPDPRPKRPPPGPASPKEFGDAHWYKVDPAHPPSTSGYGPSPPPAMPEENEAVTPTSDPESPDLSPLKQPEDEVLPGPPPSPDNQPVDLQAAIIAAKAKAKVPGTTRDHVGDAAQRELRPAERSLDPGE